MASHFLSRDLFLEGCYMEAPRSSVQQHLSAPLCTTRTQVYVEEHFCSLLLGLKQKKSLGLLICIPICLCLCLYLPLPLPAPMRVGHIAPPVLLLLKWVFTFQEKPAATFDAVVEVLVVAHPPSIYHWAGILPGPHSPAVCTVYITITNGKWFHGFRTGYNHR